LDVPGQIDTYTEIEMAKHRRKPAGGSQYECRVAQGKMDAV
jgi:hypothetical protein